MSCFPMSLPLLPLRLPLEDSAALPRQEQPAVVRVEELYQQLRPSLVRYLLSLGLGEADAEEVVQECFLALHRHLAQQRPEEHLRGWLFRVAHNLGLKARMNRQRQRDLSEEILEDASLAGRPADPEELAARNQLDARLRAVVRALPELERNCLVLRAEGLRYREIAETLSVSLGSVANAMARALEKLSSVAAMAGGGR